jgi:TatD DNase family protein
MFTDAHCHPFDLTCVFPEAEAQRRKLGVCCAASATDMEEFAYNEETARKAAVDEAAGILPCFAVHPQMPAVQTSCENSLESLENLAGRGRLAAVGETGFDLYNAAFRETEAVQDRLFAVHLEIALRHELPVIIHVRRAMHKIFSAVRLLSKCKAVIFHSWPGTMEEGKALLRRGVNVYFSFGAVILLNHRQAMRCCAAFPSDRLLVETDAPFQPPRGQGFSQWADLPCILEAAAALRREAGSPAANAGELETLIEENFKAAFASGRPLQQDQRPDAP